MSSFSHTVLRSHGPPSRLVRSWTPEVLAPLPLRPRWAVPSTQRCSEAPCSMYKCYWTWARPSAWWTAQATRPCTWLHAPTMPAWWQLWRPTAPPHTPPTACRARPCMQLPVPGDTKPAMRCWSAVQTQQPWTMCVLPRCTARAHPACTASLLRPSSPTEATRALPSRLFCRTQPSGPREQAAACRRGQGLEGAAPPRRRCATSPHAGWGRGGPCCSGASRQSRCQCCRVR